MSTDISRRALLASIPAAVLNAQDLDERIGIMCQFEPEERAARDVLAAARTADFRRIQVFFPWDRAEPKFLRALPGWIVSEDLKAEVLSAYVNCAAPGNLLMDTRAEDFDRAIDFAGELGVSHLVAWTGGFGQGLMTSDPRNFTREATDAICRFFEPRLKRLAAKKVTVALESYITLACPDAGSLRALLDRLPESVGAVLDPPNLTPLSRYAQRDAVFREMVRTLQGRIAVVHMKDFRLAKDGRSYDLPGPLGGVMNYRAFFDCLKTLPAEIPIVAEHIAPEDFAATRRKLVRFLAGS